MAHRAARQPTPPVTRSGERALFGFSLVTLSLAAAYCALALLTRVFPALFPGQELAIGGFNVAGTVPFISNPDAGSAFNQPKNILILGVDRRPDQPADFGLTDTIMLASIDPSAKTLNLLSFPRDLWIESTGSSGQSYHTKINASYPGGYNNGGGFKGGARQVKEDFKRNFGVEVDFVVVIDFAGVEKLVDAIGGIDVDIPEELAVDDWWYSDDDIHARWLRIPPGLQHLDGYNAVAFGRDRRDGNGDFDRIRRQQLVFDAAVRKVFANGLMNDWLGLWNSYQDTVTTDLSAARMGGLAPLVQQTRGQLRSFSIASPVNGVETVQMDTIADQSVLTWRPENVQYWLDQAFHGTYSTAHVEVRSGYGAAGEAQAAAVGRYLRYSHGITDIGIAAPELAASNGTHVVAYGDDRRDFAADLASWLGLPPTAVRVESGDRPEGHPDVVVTVGPGYRVPDS